MISIARSRLVRAVVLTAAISFGKGCAPQHDSPSSLRRVHTQIGWVDPGSNNFHGRFLRERNFDLSFCAPCHAESESWQCVSCHDYPHLEGFQSVHKDRIRSQITTVAEFNSNPAGAQSFLGYNTCLSCHSISGQQQQKPTCTSCHAGGTKGFTDHTSVQALMSSHVEQVEERGTGPCETCHSLSAASTPASQTIYFDKFGTAYRPPLCVECHTSPQNLLHWGIAGWGPTADSSGVHPNHLYTQKCSPCHGQYPNFSGRIEGGYQVIRGCSSCHAGFYGMFEHNDPLSSHSTHLIQAAANLSITARQAAERRCFSCHSMNDNRAVTDQYTGQQKAISSCANCHTDDDSLMHWGIAGWGPTADSSGVHPNHLYTQSCSPCHGAYPTFEGKNQGGNQVIRGCQSCHAGFYGMFEHNNPLSTHSAYLMEAAADLGLTAIQAAERRCFACHTMLSERTVTDQYTGLEKNIPSCVSCHTQSHFSASWVSITDGGEHKNEVASGGFNQCRSCHGENFEGTPTVPPCASCHAEGRNYGIVPHITADWPNRNGHGNYVRANGTAKCEICHSVNDPSVSSTTWPDGTEIKSCYFCHNGPTGMPESHGTNWPLYSPTNILTHSGYLLVYHYNPLTWVMNLGPTGGNCASCHYDGGRNWSTCTPCHASYPRDHITYNPNWMTSGNSNSHSVLYGGTYPTSCANNCHGTGLLGGSSGVSCYLCHSF